MKVNIKKLALGAQIPSDVVSSVQSQADVVNREQFLKAQQAKQAQAQKAKNLQTAGNVMSYAGQASDVLGNFVEARGTSGEHGELTQNIDKGYDAIADAALSSGNPYAMIVGGAMKVNDFVGDAMSNITIGDVSLGTDGQTKSDAIMNSAFFASNIGAINAALGKDMEKMNYDEEAWGKVGSSYAGSQKAAKDASENTGGRYGWLSTITGEYQKDLEQQREAERQQTIVSKISDEATEATERASSTIQEATLNQQKKLQGQSFTFRVKKGIKLPTKEDIQKTKKMFTGGIVIPTEAPDYTLSFEDGGKTEEKPKTRSIEELIQYAKEQNPRFVQRMTEPLKYLDLGNGDHATHLMAWEYTDDGQAMAFPTVMEDIEGNLQNYKDKSLTEAYNRGDYLIMSPEEAELFTSQYKQGWPMFFQQTPSQKFAKGGTMNIIPEGELHARLHHMEQEGITKKGIPVISEEEGGEIVQHAEIERNEIIFRLEVTKKLEELMEDGSEEAALEAGKLLVEEILNNTEDRTGLIDEVE